MKIIGDKTTIGSMKLKNRLWRSATWLNMADERGFPTERLRKTYLKLAEGGVGTIITGYAHILEEEQPNPGMLGIYSDEFIPEYRKFTGEIRKTGTNIVMQICYGGSATDYRPENRVIWGPSAVAHPLFKVIPKEMGKREVAMIIRAHAEAAGRVKASGFDGIQIQAAHSYLYSQFLSPYFNQRTDEYGGSLANRSRILLETVEAVRKTVGEEYPVFVKMHITDDWGDKGITADESLIIAKELERLGVSGIEFSGGNLADPERTPIRSGMLKDENQSYFAEETAETAAKLSVPVISVGGNRNLEKINKILSGTEISYFSLSRVLLAEPDLPKRWMGGGRVKPRCVGCCKCWSYDGNRCILDRQ